MSRGGIALVCGFVDLAKARRRLGIRDGFLFTPGLSAHGSRRADYVRGMTPVGRVDEKRTQLGPLGDEATKPLLRVQDRLQAD